MTRKIRLAYLVTHPIQYQAPLLRQIASHPDIALKVFFCSDFSVNGYSDKEFGQTVQWDVPLLEGYDFEFLPSRSDKTDISFLRPMVYGIKTRLQTGRFDALWVHGWGHWSHIWAITVARKLGIKTLLRGESSLHLPGHPMHKQLLKAQFLKWLFSMTDGYLAIGRWNKEFYLYYGVDEGAIRMMPYAVDNDFFREKSTEAVSRFDSIKASVGLEPGRPVILYASKLTERKRALDLLEAYARLSQDGSTEPEPYLLIIGDGEMRKVLESRTENLGWDSIKFLGFKNQTELPMYYSLCDIFVLPSMNEPWGLVVNEVMNAGKAVIVSDQVGSGADLVKNGENGFVFRASDISELHRCLADALMDSRFVSMGQRSIEIINDWGFSQDVAGLRELLDVVGAGREV